MEEDGEDGEGMGREGRGGEGGKALGLPPRESWADDVFERNRQKRSFRSHFESADSIYIRPI